MFVYPTHQVKMGKNFFFFFNSSCSQSWQETNHSPYFPPFLLPCSSVEYPSEITSIIHLSIVVFIHWSWKKSCPSPSLDWFLRQQCYSGTLLLFCYFYPNQQYSWLEMIQLCLPWVTVESSLSFWTLLNFLASWSLQRCPLFILLSHFFRH